MHVLNILWVVFGIGLMLVLNLKFKINSMVALLVAALSVGMLAGMDLMSLLHTMKAGFGNTLGELAIIVVFGAVIGKLMVDSGAAHQIAHTLLARLGLRYVQLSVIIIGLIFGLAMFYEVAFIMLAPLVIVIAAEAKIPFLKLAIPAVAAATTAHSLFPPQPGPVALVNAYGADMGMVYIYGVLVTIPSVICAGLILPKFLGNLERPTPSFLKADQPVDMNNLPSFGVSILVPLIPAIIMISTTIANIWLVKDTPAWEVVNFIGSSPIAMFIAMVVAFVLFGTARGHDMQWVMNAFESAVKSIAMVILIIGAGGVLEADYHRHRHWRHHRHVDVPRQYLALHHGMADHCANSSGDGSGCRFGDDRRRDYKCCNPRSSNWSAGWRESGAAGTGDGCGFQHPHPH